VNGAAEGAMTPAELRALGTATDIPTAARALGLSRAAAYRAAEAGTLPCPVLRIGHRYVVPTAGLLAVLGIEPQ
jgi:hypothetical protein